MKVEPCLDIIPVGETALPFDFLQFLCGVIAPSLFAQERVENVDLVFGGSSPFLEAPFQEFVVAAAFEGPLHDCGILHFQKLADSMIGTNSAIVVVRQFAGRVKAYFVEHASEEYNSTDGLR